MTMLGSMTITAAALISPYSGPMSVVSPAMTTGRVFAFDAAQDEREEELVPGDQEREDRGDHEAGGDDRDHHSQRASPSRLQPSIMAASSISIGTSMKNPMRSQIVKGRANDT